jgi:chromosome partitioning protein
MSTGLLGLSCQTDSFQAVLKTIPVINSKGGVGKTTTAVNVAAGLARAGRKILLVDLDSQGSASVSLGVSQKNLSPSSADVLFGEATIQEAVRPTGLDTLDLVTGSLDLANADIQLKSQKGGERRLDAVLAEVASEYDQILVDCAPSTSILTVNALVAADAFIVPVAPSYLALEGVVSLGETIRRVREGIGEAAPILGVLLTMVDKTQSEDSEAIEEVRSHYGGKVFETEIREDPTLEEAPGRSQDIFRYAPESGGASDYAALVEEIEDRLKRYGAIYNGIASKAKRAAARGAKGEDGKVPA